MWGWSEIVISILCHRWQTQIEHFFILTPSFSELHLLPPHLLFPNSSSAEQPMLCLCAPSSEIRASSGTPIQPLSMLCHFHTFFHPSFQNSQHRSSQVTPWGKVGLQELWPLCLSRFSLWNLHLSEEIPSQIWNTEFAPLRAGTALFLCRREMKIYLDDNLEKQRILPQKQESEWKEKAWYHRNSTLHTEQTSPTV